MKTRNELLDLGGKHLKDSWTIIMPDGTYWVEKPSENGNGWYAGDCSDTGNLIYIINNEG